MLHTPKECTCAWEAFKAHNWDLQEGRGTENLGILLLTFLMRYGSSFDYDMHAVSVGQGGVISRASLADPIPAGHIVQVIVEDVDTKRCVASFH